MRVIVSVAAVLVNNANERLQHRIHRRPLRQRSSLTKARDRVIKDPRFLGTHRVIAESISLHRAWPKSLHEDIRALDQAPKDCLAFRSLQIDRDAAFS